MRSLVMACLASMIAAATAQSPSAPHVGIENVAAFSRLYGVVRYFYPGDAAAALDWDRHAVHGVSRVLRARDVSALERALEELFTPLGPGIEIDPRLPPPPAAGSLDPSLVAWRYVGPGIATSTRYSPYTAKRTNRPAVSTQGADFVTIIPNPVFQAESRTRGVGLFQSGASRIVQITRPEVGGSNGQLFFRLRTMSSSRESSQDVEPTVGAHIDFDVAPGLKARVRLALTDAEARAEFTTLEELRRAVDAVEAPSGRFDTEVRLADVVVAWNVFRHFYPYWPEAQVDWDARLQPQFEITYKASTREAQRRALRQLVADARDGHGFVGDSGRETSVPLPIQLRVIDGRLVITASSMPSEAPVGAVVTVVDGVAAAERVAEEMRLVSGTVQWKQWQAARQIATCPRGAAVRMALEVAGAAARETSLPCDLTQPPAESRPARIGELAPRIWYIDLTRASWAEISPRLPTLASAAAVVFDVRGYPTDAGGKILPYLITAEENDRWMHIANIVGPFGQIADWRSIGWNLKPATPHLSGRRLFLTDGRAISYAESVMGYVADGKLGAIIGSTTAGTNGNVAAFRVPGGFTIGFTGMRVTGHDGQTPHHLAGVRPDIAVEPTLAGVRDMRDEVLERALAVSRAPQ